MKITKKLILDTIATECNIKREYVDLQKYEGFYYWGEKSGAVFVECCLYMTRLDDWPLHRWIEDFKDKSAKCIASNNCTTLQDHIESIDWRL